MRVFFKLIIALVLGIVIGVVFVSSTVSAADWDNTKEFEESGEYGKIHIDNWLGLGKRLATYELLDNSDQCVTDCFAEGKVSLFVEDTLFDNMAFEIPGGKAISLGGYKIHLLETTSEEVTVSDYELQCSKVPSNITTKDHCERVEVGSHKETVTTSEWAEYDGGILPIGDYEWRLEGRKLPGQRIDWIGESMGVTLDEWVWWNTAWVYRQNVSVTEVNEVAGHLGEPFPIIFPTQKLIADGKVRSDCGDLRAIYDNGFNESVLNVSGCDSNNTRLWVNNTFNFPAGNSTNISIYYGNPIATAVDYNPDISAVSANITTDVAYNDSFSPPTYASKEADFSDLAGGFDHSTTTNNFYTVSVFVQNNITFDRNYSMRQFDIRGDTDGGKNLVTAQVGYWDYASKEWINITTNTTTADAVFNNLTLNNHNTGFSDQWALYGWGNPIGLFEVAFDDDRFWTGEILETALSGGEEELVDIPPTIVLNSPDDAFESLSPFVFFNWTVTDNFNVTNTSLFINQVLNETIFNATDAIVEVTLNLSFPEGEYNWTTDAFDNSSVFGNSSVRNFTVDFQLPPTFVVTAPETDQNFSGIDNDVNVTVNVTTTDVALDTCFYNTTDTAAITIYTCNTDFNITFTSSGNKTIQISANDTAGRENSTFVSINAVKFNITQSQISSTITEGSENNITLIVNTSTEDFTDVQAILIWNNTNFGSGGRTVNGDEIRFDNTFSVPIGTGNSSGKSVDWRWQWNATAYVNNTNTSVMNQSVFTFSADDCTTQTDLVLNYTILDEESQFEINTSAENTSIEVDVNISSIQNRSISTQVAFNKSNILPVQVCVNEGSLNGSNFRLDAQVRYFSSNRVVEFNNIQNQTISNATIPIHVNLLNLLTADSQEFLISVKDENFLALSNALITISRRYVGEGTSKTVEAPLTDTDGRTIGHFVLSDVIYDISVSKEGQPLRTFVNVLARCDNVATGDCRINLNLFSVGVIPTEFNKDLGISWNMTFDRTNRIVTAVYSIPTGLPAEVELNSTKFDNRGNETLCSNSVNSSVGTLTCTIASSSGNITFVSQLFRDGQFVGQAFYAIRPTAESTFRGTRIILMLIMFVTLPLMALTSGPIAIVMAMMGIVAAALLNLYDTGAFIGAGSTLLWFFIAGGIIWFKAVRRSNP